MGTSGSYGGSNSQRWQDARARLNDVLSDGGDIDPLVQSIAEALIGDDPSVVRPASGDDSSADDVELPEILPPLLVQPMRPARRAARGSGAGGGGSVVGRSRGTTRSGGGRSGRQLSRAVRRGGVALGSAYALRRGDADALRDVGLDLGELQAMTPRAQRLALLNATIGEGTHPDDVALRRAADEFLKQVLTAEAEPAPADLIRDFVGSYLHNLGVLELARQLDQGDIDQRAAVAKEREIKDWMHARLRREDFGIQGPIVALRDFQRIAARLAATALTILRAGG